VFEKTRFGVNKMRPKTIFRSRNESNDHLNVGSENVVYLGNLASEAETWISSLCINMIPPSITQILLVIRRSVCFDVILKMQLQYINRCGVVHTFGFPRRQPREEGIEV
jgi:hypothetical protein